MKMTRTLTTTLLLVFLASCVNIPYKPIYQYKHFADSCAVRCFNYNTLKLASDSKCGENFKTDLRRPARECDGILGPYIDDYAQDIKPAAIEAIQACKDLRD